MKILEDRYKIVLKKEIATSIADAISKIKLSILNKNSSSYNEIILLESAILDLELKQRNALISTQDYISQKNQIVHRALQTIDSINNSNLQVILTRNYNLKIKKFDGSTSSILLIDNELIRIGRNQDNDICLEEGSVSRYHCELRTNFPTIRVKDMKSRNKTFINNKVIEEAVWEPGKKMRIGNSLFELVDEGATD